MGRECGVSLPIFLQDEKGRCIYRLIVLVFLPYTDAVVELMDNLAAIWTAFQ